MASATPSTALPKGGFTLSHRVLVKLIVTGVVLLLLGLGLLVARAIQQLPPAAIFIQPQGLNAQEHASLTTLLGKHADGNLLQADLPTYIQRLKQVDWVDQVDIRRDWPQGLVVTVVPRKPVAKFGSERFVDANGVVFVPADPHPLQSQDWIQLQGNSQNALVIMQQVQQVSNWYLPLGLKVNEVIVTPRMTWLFRFDNGLRVLVDNEDTSEKLYRLSVMLQNQLRAQVSKFQTIDLRYKNGMAVTWRSPLSGTTDSSEPAKVNAAISRQ